MSASAVWPRTAEFDGPRLRSVGGVAVEDLVAAHGTPLWVLDRQELVGRMRAYREAFGGGATVVYATKALAVVGVLQLAVAEGLWLDVASAGELHAARLAGAPMERVVLHGNNKSAEELALAVELGVGRLVVDSFDELDRLEALGAQADVALRLTPGVAADTHAAVVTGADDSKFGFSIARGLAAQAADRVRASNRLRLRGLHVHVGSQIRDLEPFAAGIAAVGAFAQDAGLDIAELNVGGGLAIAYTAGERVLAVQDYAKGVRVAVAEAFTGRPPALLVEPGRWIAGPAGITLYRVGTVKRIPDVATYVAVDGGMSDNPRPALYGARYTVAAAGPGPAGPGEVVTLAGKHCESGDVLARGVTLPAPARDSLVAIAATGAYAHAMASNYNRLPRPGMVLVGDGRADVLLRRETLEDVTRLDVPLASRSASRA